MNHASGMQLHSEVSTDFSVPSDYTIEYSVIMCDMHTQFLMWTLWTWLFPEGVEGSGGSSLLLLLWLWASRLWKDNFCRGRKGVVVAFLLWLRTWNDIDNLHFPQDSGGRVVGVRKWFYCSNVFMTLFYIYSVVTEGYGVFPGPSHSSEWCTIPQVRSIVSSYLQHELCQHGWAAKTRGS